MKVDRFFYFFLVFLFFCFFLVPKVQANTNAIEEHEFSLQDLGYEANLKAYGVDGSVGFDFVLPSYENIHQLDMAFRYRVSSALLKEVSHVVIYLNNNVVSVLDINDTVKGKEQQETITLPVGLLKKQNVIEAQLIGHYTFSCEDPMHASLWMEIEKETTLSLQAENRVLLNDLSILPAPFFEKGSREALRLPFVLYDTSSPYLEAAASVASWFGLKAGYQGASFPVFLSQVPEQGHAVIILKGNESLSWMPSKIQQADSFIGVISNPNDMAGKFLIIKGKDSEHIKKASLALALAGDVFSGAEVIPTTLEEKKRKPYDAPAWVDTSKIISLRELAPNSSLTASGFFAEDVRIGLRLPPDLYSWKNKAALLNLRYRYSLQASTEQALLQVSANHNHVATIPLTSREQIALSSINAKTGYGEQEIPLALSDLGSVATLQFDFNYHVPVLKACQNSIVDSYRSAIDPSSTIDLRGFPHFMPMPNLAAFVTAGFPYTKMADLSETVVVLSDKATAHEYAIFLTMMAKIATDTGYPVTRLQVSKTGDKKDLKNKDVIVLSFNQTHPLLNEWAGSLPEKFIDGVHEKPSVLSRLWGWVRLDSDSNSLVTNHTLNKGLTLAQFESPITNKRTVVVLSAAKAENAFNAINQLISKPSLMAQVQGEVSSIGLEEVKSVNSAPYYYVGKLTLWMTILWHLEQHPFLLIVLFLIGALLMSLVLFWLLRTQASRRLNLNSKINQTEKDSIND